MKFQISRRSDVALRALRHTGAIGGPVSGRVLADITDASPAYLSQCLSPMVAAGWLTSRPGPDGGYELTAAGRTVTLLDLIELLEGPLADGRCVLNKDECSSTRPCTLHTTWSAAREELKRALAAVPAVT